MDFSYTYTHVYEDVQKKLEQPIQMHMGKIHTQMFYFVQALMQDAAKTPNVVEACNKPGLYETLEDTQKRYISLLAMY